MITLEYQVEAIGRAVAGLAEQAAGTPSRLMVARDVQECIDAALGLFGEVQRLIVWWNAASTDGTNQDADFLAFPRELERHYRQLSAGCEKLAGLISTIEAWGYSIQRKAEFAVAARTLRGMSSLSVDRAAESVAQIERGEGRPLRDVIRDLRAHSLT